MNLFTRDCINNKIYFLSNFLIDTYIENIFVINFLLIKDNECHSYEEQNITT